MVKFDSPITQSATLPGPLYYMKVRKPGNEIPMEVQMCLPHQVSSINISTDDFEVLGFKLLETRYHLRYEYMKKLRI